MSCFSEFPIPLAESSVREKSIEEGSSKVSLCLTHCSGNWLLLTSSLCSARCHYLHTTPQLFSQNYLSGNFIYRPRHSRDQMGNGVSVSQALD